MSDTIAPPARRVDKAEKSARNRAYHGYIRNALEPTSAAVFDDMTIADLKAAARRWADDSWMDYLQ